MIPTFQRYLDRKLGGRHGAAAWRRFFIWPFEASSFAEFWRRWNPIYGYALTFYVYRPLSHFLPRRVALFVTFLACGFVLHDIPAWIAVRRILPPGATITFALFAVGAIAGDALGMDIAGWPPTARIATNVTYVGACVGAMLFAVLRFLA